MNLICVGMRKRANSTDQVELPNRGENRTIVEDLDWILAELARVGLHFALVHPSEASYRKDLEVYGEALDKLQAVLRRIKVSQDDMRRLGSSGPET